MMSNKLNEVDYISMIYVSNKYDDTKKVEILKNHFFRYAKVDVSEEFKLAKTIEWMRTLDSLLFMPKHIIENLNLYSSCDVALKDYDYRLINKVADKINSWYESFKKEKYLVSDYDEVFNRYAETIHPSHSKRGNMSHSEIDKLIKIQNQIKDENPELFDRLRKSCNRFNTSIDLVIYVGARLFVLEENDDGTYEFNLRNEYALKLIREYNEKTNTERYKNEYDKISLIRSILNDLLEYCFSKNFKLTKSGLIIMKRHSKVVATIKNNKVGRLDSKSIYNYFITFNNLSNKLLKLFHSSKIKYNNKLLIKRNKSSTNFNNSS